MNEPTMRDLVRQAKREILLGCASHAENVFLDEGTDREYRAHEIAAEQISDELFRRAQRLTKKADYD